MNTKLLSIRLGHDSNLAFFDGDAYQVVELERVFGIRHFDWRMRGQEITFAHLTDFVKAHYGDRGFEKAVNSDGIREGVKVARAFGIQSPVPAVSHHLAHAACALYQSPFPRCLIISYDGGGGDGYIRAFEGDKHKGVTYLNSDSIPQFSLGLGYRSFGHATAEIRKKDVSSTKRFYGLEFAGKLMGLAAYGTPNAKLIPEIVDYMLSLRMTMDPHQRLDALKTLGDRIGIQLERDSISGAESFMIAATVQAAFEQIMFKIIEPLAKKHRLPIVLTGGCALNVIFNEKLASAMTDEVWVPPNPNDCGLGLGGLFLHDPPKGIVNVMYSGIPIVDKNDLDLLANARNAVRVSTDYVAEILASGAIVGIVRGKSEHGPRALGNRSLLCDPSVPGMKDRLNRAVKFREDFRPYAPMVRKENAKRYFESGDYDASFMSFNPQVRNEWREKLRAVTHLDGSSRMQTVSKTSNHFIYELLGAFERVRGFGVLLNTSLNTKGRPIVSSVQEALSCLDNTDMDYCLVEEFLFKKNRTTSAMATASLSSEMRSGVREGIPFCKPNPKV